MDNFLSLFFLDQPSSLLAVERQLFLKNMLRADKQDHKPSEDNPHQDGAKQKLTMEQTGIYIAIIIKQKIFE